jgi:alpha-galactosidase
MKERIVLIGAGSAMFTRGVIADLVSRKWDVDLALVDVDAKALAVAENLGRKILQAGGSRIRLTASVDRRKALSGATAVITTIGVGGRRAWEQDVFVPRKYGIYQPVGDTVMPGGTSRALRMIPAMVDIARDVLELAPDALFFNYSNPMTALCRAVRKATGADVTGLCHGVFHTAGYLAEQLNVPAAKFDYSAVGINHLTWFTRVESAGRDMLPRLRELAEKKLAHGPAVGNLGATFLEQGSVGSGSPPLQDEVPFSWWLTKVFGAFPCARDRHVAEFFPFLFSRKGSYFGGTLGVYAYRFENTIAHGDRTYEEMVEMAGLPGPLPREYLDRIGGEHEQVLDIIESIRTDARRVYSANLPNRGQIPNLPPDVIVESPAVAGREGLRPLPQPPLPTAPAGVLAPRWAWVETTVDAALEGSREKFIQALVLDGAVDSLSTAHRLADDLLSVQAEYLPQFAQ